VKKKPLIIASASIFVIGLALLIPTTASAEGLLQAGSQDGWGVTFGYAGMKFDGSGSAFVHSTHTDDVSFLGAGSAGKTDLGDEPLDFGSIGFRYQRKLMENVIFNAEVGWMGGDARDEKQNINDPRPAANGSFIYSKLENAVYVGVGLSYDVPNVKGLYIGADVQATALFIEHGWDRFGSDQAERDETEWTPSLCPKVGFKFGENMAIEGSAVIGESVGGTVKFVLTF
jgi:hypothetical protein